MQVLRVVKTIAIKAMTKCHFKKNLLGGNFEGEFQPRGGLRG